MLIFTAAGLQIRPSVNHRFVSRAVESTEEEGLFARLLHLAIILTDALKHHVELVGREAADEDIAALALLAQHTIAGGSAQGEGPAAVGMVEHAHGYKVKRLLTITFLLLQDFLFRHDILFKIIIADRLTAVLAAAIAAKIDKSVNG